MNAVASSQGVRVGPPTDHLTERRRRIASNGLCTGCGQSLVGRRPQAVWCSDRCRLQTTRMARAREDGQVIDAIAAALTRAAALVGQLQARRSGGRS